ncbi:dienelactone hydrolase family protein [Bacillus sp. WMMC1349]|uniref:dienelactone hydrolase family protein n=1 Tax=Bacillus sp. WMMC1349 TaxID=2736254 RepID=UPI0015578D5B|nr:dienelactone hydrolase family protein [Bacillus sp. WMMC1349]NPC91314.1 dienelactone hydrolase family protein [Bacillus sp. WMMC1349]
MIHMNKQSDRLILLVHEIYGINQHMIDVSRLLSEQGFDLICPNLLERKTPFDYTQEEIAYDHFMKNIGFAHAADKIKRLLVDIQDKYKSIYIVGFSVGATVAWLCSEEKGLNGIIGYYGSRIRDYLEIKPSCPTLLFFPEEEQSFHVNDIISRLDHHIMVHQFSGLHGFSDPYSSRYNENSAQKAFTEVVNFLKKHHNR